MESLGKTLIGVGILIAIIGVVLQSGLLKNVPLGRLPGDINVQREGFSFMFPITTMLLASAILTGISYLIGMLRR